MDLRGFGDTDPEPVDATRGVRDYSDDVARSPSTLRLAPAHLVGWSLGGGVVLQYLLDAPQPTRLPDPGGPGVAVRFRRHRRRRGRRCPTRRRRVPAAACANPGFVARLAAGDRGDDSALSPRQVLLAHYVKPPFVPPNTWTSSSNRCCPPGSARTTTPGMSTVTDVWPGFAPGDRGVLNTMAPKLLPHRRPDQRRPEAADPVGAREPTTSSSPTPRCTTSPTSARSASSRAGRERSPLRRSRWSPRPGTSLDGYAAAGGSYREVAIADAGHSPFLERPAEFLAAFEEHLGSD